MIRLKKNGFPQNIKFRDGSEMYCDPKDPMGMFTDTSIQSIDGTEKEIDRVVLIANWLMCWATAARTELRRIK